MSCKLETYGIKRCGINIVNTNISNSFWDISERRCWKTSKLVEQICLTAGRCKGNHEELASLKRISRVAWHAKTHYFWKSVFKLTSSSENKTISLTSAFRILSGYNFCTILSPPQVCHYTFRTNLPPFFCFGFEGSWEKSSSTRGGSKKRLDVWDSLTCRDLVQVETSMKTKSLTPNRETPSIRNNKTKNRVIW